MYTICIYIYLYVCCIYNICIYEWWIFHCHVRLPEGEFYYGVSVPDKLTETLKITNVEWKVILRSSKIGHGRHKTHWEVFKSCSHV